jgi:hypothetical protein
VELEKLVMHRHVPVEVEDDVADAVLQNLPGEVVKHVEDTAEKQEASLAGDDSSDPTPAAPSSPTQ